MPDTPPAMQRRVSCRGAIMVAGQRIHVGIGHAGETVAVTAEGDTFQIYDDERLLAEVARTTAKPIARFKARKPEPPRVPQRGNAERLANRLPLPAMTGVPLGSNEKPAVVS